MKFILATTEPEKVLPTILSRCQRYDFRNIPTREIAAHLKEICRNEKIDAEEDALLLVANLVSFGLFWILKYMLYNRLFHVHPVEELDDLVEAV